MKGRTVYGLDLGINNVGWCAVEKSEEGLKFLATGTYAFDSPLADENKPQEGLSSKVRGLQRRARRTTRRRHQRKMAMYRLLAEHGLLPKDYQSRVNLFCAAPDPYALRAAALTRELTPYELGRVICHLNQRRGFLSPRDLMLWGVAKFELESDPEDSGEAKDADPEAKPGIVKKQLQATKDAMAGHETIGAYLYSRLSAGQPVRKRVLKVQDAKGKNVPVSMAKQATEDEHRFVRFDRHMTEHELNTILERQSQYHSILTAALQQKIKGLLFQQRILAADASTRGRCTFLKAELRMPRASITAQRFVLAQDVAHLLVVPTALADARPLTASERNALLGALMNGQALSWAEVKNAASLPETAIFTIEPPTATTKTGRQKKSKQPPGTKKELRGSQTVARMRAILGEKWDDLGEQAQRELVGEIVSIRDWTKDAKKDTKPAAFRRLELFGKKSYGPNRVGFTEREATELATVSLPEGYLNISLKAAKRIMPGMLVEKSHKVSIANSDGEIIDTMLTGPLVYSDACLVAGFDHANPDGPLKTLDRLPFPGEQDISHAIVRASVQSAVRILNTLRKEFGKPDAIHIELPRDLAKGAKERLEDELRMKENEKVRTRIRKELASIGIRPSSKNIRKVQLWEELGGAALPYEPNVVIADIKALMTGDYEEDHIVPRGHGIDTSKANMTLATRECNSQRKGNKTPYEAWGRTDDWPDIVAHVKSIKSMPLHKRNRILAKERPDDFTGRHLAATGYISRVILKLAQQLVDNPHDVLVVPGRATAEFRKFWDLEGVVPLHPEEKAVEDAWKELMDKAEKGKATDDEISKAKAPGKARSNFKHHALDAVVTALADQGSLQAMASYFQLVDENDPRLADKEARKLERAKALPDPNLRDKVAEALEMAAIVHRPNRKPKGELHKQMAQKENRKGLEHGEPKNAEIVDGTLVRYDHEGRPAQAFPLGNNHHVVIWERTEPNKKAEFEREAEVIPMIEAVRRRNELERTRQYNRAHPDSPRPLEPIIRKTHPEPGWRFVMALCKNDTVETTDGRIGVVSTFYSPSIGKAKIAIWQLYAANQSGKVNEQNPYLVKNLSVLGNLKARLVIDPLGKIVYREGGRE